MTDKKVKTKKANEELEYPIYLFNEGTNSDAFRLMRPTDMGDGTWRFRVWAPNAQSVSVVGEFNGWDRSAAPMKRIGGGILLPAHGNSARKRFQIIRFRGFRVDRRRVYGSPKRQKPYQ